MSLVFGLIIRKYICYFDNLSSFGVHSQKKKKKKRSSFDLITEDIIAPTVDVGYVPNAKYLAHIPHQTQKLAP